MPNPTNHQSDRPSRSVKSEERNISFRRNEPGRPSSPLRPCCISPPYRHQRKSESIMTTGRYPCLVPPGTVTPKLTGQIQQPPESDRSSARTGILSSLLFSRSSKLFAHTKAWGFTSLMASVLRSSGGSCLRGAKSKATTTEGFAQPGAKVLRQRTFIVAAKAQDGRSESGQGAAVSTQSQADHYCRERDLS